MTSQEILICEIEFLENAAFAVYLLVCKIVAQMLRLYRTCQKLSVAFRNIGVIGEVRA